MTKTDKNNLVTVLKYMLIIVVAISVLQFVVGILKPLILLALLYYVGRSLVKKRDSEKELNGDENETR